MQRRAPVKASGSEELTREAAAMVWGGECMELEKAEAEMELEAD